MEIFLIASKAYFDPNSKAMSVQRELKFIAHVINAFSNEKNLVSLVKIDDHSYVNIYFELDSSYIRFSLLP